MVQNQSLVLIWRFFILRSVVPFVHGQTRSQEAAAFICNFFSSFYLPWGPLSPAPSLPLSLAGCHKSAIKMMYGPTENGYASSAALSAFSLSLSLCVCLCMFLCLFLTECKGSTEMQCLPLSLPFYHKFFIVLSFALNLSRSIEMCRAGSLVMVFHESTIVLAVCKGCMK